MNGRGINLTNATPPVAHRIAIAVVHRATAMWPSRISLAKIFRERHQADCFDIINALPKGVDYGASRLSVSALQGEFNNVRASVTRSEAKARRRRIPTSSMVALAAVALATLLAAAAEAFIGAGFFDVALDQAGVMSAPQRVKP